MDIQFINESKKKLLEEKLRLETMLGNFAQRKDKADHENFRTTFPNMGDGTDDNAMEVEMYATNLGEEKTLEIRLDKVNNALSRIAAGAWGRCVVGGEPIEKARLLVAPEADTCVTHAS